MASVPFAHGYIGGAEVIVVSAFLELLTCRERELRYGGGPSLAHVPARWLVSHAQAIYRSVVRPVRGQSVRAVLQALSYQAARPYSPC